jgi:signal transduction histidine kinase
MLGTPRGIYLLKGSDSHWMTSKDGLAIDDTRVIIGDRRGDIWVGGYGGLTRIHDGKMTRWTEQQGLPSNNVRCVHEDSDGDIWVGTYDGGVGWLRDDKWVVFNEARGLYDNGAYQILDDSLGHFWISSSRGIYRVSKKQLKDVASGRESRVASVAYGRADGMLSVECNGGVWPAGAKDDRGFLWFPTQNGLAVIDPASLSVVSQAPKVIIESASIEHKAVKDFENVVLKPGQTNLEVDYTALSYSKPEQISFRYRLDGADEVWQEVGRRRTAYYSHLAPGDYVFHVSATNSDGIASASDGTLMVSVVPPFYRRWWFIVAVALAVLAFVGLLWQYRVRQLKRAQAAQQAFSQQLIASQESDRRRIAAELHDSLGQRMIIINNLALYLLRPQGKTLDEEAQIQIIEDIRAEASHAIEETRAISYDLRPFQLDRLGLSKAIQALVKSVAQAAQIELTAEVADIDDAFPEDLRINVYRILQEALNNMVKHSGATRGSVMAARTKSSVVLTVSDNGKGLAMEPRNVNTGIGGFGLIGISERATLLKGTLHIKGDTGTGTLLSIKFPVKSGQQP